MLLFSILVFSHAFCPFLNRKHLESKKNGLIYQQDVKSTYYSQITIFTSNAPPSISKNYLR